MMSIHTDPHGQAYPPTSLGVLAILSLVSMRHKATAFELIAGWVPM